jgi:Flp pilus assembly protein TadG
MAGGGSTVRGQRGAAAVEFALVLPVLLLVILGAIDWGYYFYLQQIVVNGAREAARAGSLQPTDGAAAVSDAEAACGAYLTSAGLTPAKATCAASAAGANVSVTLTYPGGSITGFTGTFVPTNVKAQVQMRR